LPQTKRNLTALGKLKVEDAGKCQGFGKKDTKRNDSPVMTRGGALQGDEFCRNRGVHSDSGGDVSRPNKGLINSIESDMKKEKTWIDKEIRRGKRRKRGGHHHLGTTMDRAEDQKGLRPKETLTRTLRTRERVKESKRFLPLRECKAKPWAGRVRIAATKKKGRNPREEAGRIISVGTGNETGTKRFNI